MLLFVLKESPSEYILEKKLELPPHKSGIFLIDWTS